jgi:2,4-dienoyl-CoA reductase-like NADH-dependent reductase (Old Yellow Enzyme family)
MTPPFVFHRCDCPALTIIRGSHQNTVPPSFAHATMVTGEPFSTRLKGTMKMSDNPMNQPLKLPCGVVLKNRLVKSPMSDSLGDGRGDPSAAQIRLYERWALGGVGLSIIGEVQTDPRYPEKPGNLVLGPQSNDALLKELTSRATIQEAHLWPQLGHAGALAHSPLSRPKGPSPLQVEGLHCDGMTQREVKRLPTTFATAAQHARRVGFTGVHLHAGHGFLLSQFLSPLFNHRRDEYGGSIESRAQIILEIISTVRKAVGTDFPIGIRMNSSDMLQGGLTKEDALELVRILDNTSIDLIDVSGGTYFPGAKSASEGASSGPYFLDFVRAARRITQKPLIVSGGFKQRTEVLDALESGSADMVGLGRSMILNPLLPRDWIHGDGRDPVFPKFAATVPGGVTAWYTMRITALGEDREDKYDLDLPTAAKLYEERDAERCNLWKDRFGTTVLVLACGYRKVYISKSGLSFPMWLVRIDDKQGVPRFVWRSKRDFLRLARPNKEVASFPKSAWHKLDEASPWQRPDFAAQTTLGKGSATALWDEASENRWHPSMKKSLLQLDQYLEKLAAETSDSSAVEAWHEFVNGGSSDYSISANRESIPTEQQRGNALGQYFCHPLNAQQLVRTGLGRWRSIRGNRHDSLLIVEPSCGHGQVVKMILEELEEANSLNTRILAIDLDEVSVSKCQENYKHKACDFVCANFMETSPLNKEGAIVVLGGPPYTTGAGSNTSNDDADSVCRDLPMQFVQHAATTYAADVICFLMPMRCRRVDYHTEGWIPSNYTYESIELESPSVFFFQGRDPVKQPSIIQLFTRTSP